MSLFSWKKNRRKKFKSLHQRLKKCTLVLKPENSLSLKQFRLLHGQKHPFSSRLWRNDIRFYSCFFLVEKYLLLQSYFWLYCRCNFFEWCLNKVTDYPLCDFVKAVKERGSRTIPTPVHLVFSVKTESAVSVKKGDTVWAKRVCSLLAFSTWS